MFDAIDSGRAPSETFYDSYVVNAVIDARYRSASIRAWEPVQLEGRSTMSFMSPRRLNRTIGVRRRYRR